MVFIDFGFRPTQAWVTGDLILAARQSDPFFNPDEINGEPAPCLLFH
jgi:hypothetical protein